MAETSQMLGSGSSTNIAPARTPPTKSAPPTSAKADANKADANKADANKADANKADANKADANKADANKADAKAEPAPLVTSRYVTVGTVVGRYQVDAIAPVGLLGPEFRAVHSDTGERVLIRFLPEIIAAGEAEVLSALLEESKRGSAVVHPQVVRLLRVAKHGSEIYIVTAFYDGVTLADRLQRARGPLPLREATETAIEIANVLEAVHRAGFVHRDVRPENVLLCDDGQIRLTGLGLVGFVEELQQNRLGLPLASVPHTSPELYQNGQTDARGDLYSLGVTLFQMLTGQYPYTADTSLQLLHRHCTAPVPDPRKLRPELPDGLAETVLACLAKKPEDRPDRASSLAEKLTALLGELPETPAALTAEPASSSGEMPVAQIDSAAYEPVAAAAPALLPRPSSQAPLTRAQQARPPQTRPPQTRPPQTRPPQTRPPQTRAAPPAHPPAQQLGQPRRPEANSHTTGSGSSTRIPTSSSSSTKLPTLRSATTGRAATNPDDSDILSQSVRGLAAPRLNGSPSTPSGRYSAVRGANGSSGRVMVVTARPPAGSGIGMWIFAASVMIVVGIVVIAAMMSRPTDVEPDPTAKAPAKSGNPRPNRDSEGPADADIAPPATDGSMLQPLPTVGEDGSTPTQLGEQYKTLKLQLDEAEKSGDVKLGDTIVVALREFARRHAQSKVEFRLEFSRYAAALADNYLRARTPAKTPSTKTSIPLPALSADKPMLYKFSAQVVHLALVSEPHRLLVAASNGAVVAISVEPSGKLAGRPDYVASAHEGAPTALTASADGKHFATAGQDHSLRLWKAADGAKIGDLEGHDSAVQAVAFSPDARQLASGDRNGNIRLWDLTDRSELPRLTADTASTATVTALAFAPGGRRLAVGRADKSVEVWDVADGKLLFRPAGATGPIATLSFTPDGGKLIAGGADVRIWDAADGSPIRSIGTAGGVMLNHTGREMLVFGNGLEHWPLDGGGPTKLPTPALTSLVVGPQTQWVAFGSGVNLGMLAMPAK